MTAHGSPTCLFSEEIGVAAVMAHVAVKHIVGHEGKTGPAEEENDAQKPSDTAAAHLLYNRLNVKYTYAVSMPNVSAVNHFIHRAHCSSTSPSCLPLSSSPEPVRASAASEPSPAVSWDDGSTKRVQLQHYI